MNVRLYGFEQLPHVASGHLRVQHLPWKTQRRRQQVEQLLQATRNENRRVSSEADSCCINIQYFIGCLTRGMGCPHIRHNPLRLWFLWFVTTHCVCGFLDSSLVSEFRHWFLRFVTTHFVCGFFLSLYFMCAKRACSSCTWSVNHVGHFMLFGLWLLIQLLAFFSWPERSFGVKFVL